MKYPTDATKENNIREILQSNYKEYENMEKIIIYLLKTIDKKKWEGACHAITSILHVLLDSIGVSSEIYIGECIKQEFTFSHSWIEIEDNVFDLTIHKPLETTDVFLSNPIVNNYEIQNKTKSKIKYGEGFFEFMDGASQFALNTPLSAYMNNFPECEDGLWYFVKKFNPKINIENLKSKHINTFRKLKHLSNWRVKSFHRKIAHFILS